MSFADAGDVVLLQRTVADAPNGNAELLHLRQTLDIVKLVILISRTVVHQVKERGIIG